MTDCVLVETGANTPVLIAIAAATILIGAALIWAMARSSKKRMLLGGALGLLLLVGLPVLSGSAPAQAQAPEHCVTAPSTPPSGQPSVQPSADPSATPTPDPSASPTPTPSPTPSGPAACVPEVSPITPSIAARFDWDSDAPRIRFENEELNNLVIANPALVTSLVETFSVPETVTWSMPDGDGGRVTLHTERYTAHTSIPRGIYQVEDGWLELDYAESGDTSNSEEIDAKIAAITAELEAQHPGAEIEAGSLFGDYTAQISYTLTGTNSCGETVTGTGSVAARGPIPA
ncbi:hypothetical protein M2390_001813 [Mycetocola sp. BIGb0189]|uniref:hypothetical protein n=1 Tax=Mycetocola sp. BIGb0189 TaxID=2940604 RepID=UPI0021673197|nr:hypothetical protein [Mycetocola sp. BIGb0189]MCS4276619.1 hypothetical protein [Mycetocola sp. BIGb0189]